MRKIKMYAPKKLCYETKIELFKYTNTNNDE